MPRRTPTYLSPSAINKFRRDPEEYYLHYIASDKPDRDPQNQAMSIGSSFDAYCKSWLHERLFGRGKDPKYAFENIFETQVESQWRDWARLHGMYVFDQYESCGALSDLLMDLQKAITDPKFEIDVSGVITNHATGQLEREPQTAELKGVMLLGKPDVFYVNKEGMHVIVDWKVNGYVSKYNISPMPGYVKLRGDHKKEGQCHPDCILTPFHGMLINGKNSLHEYNPDWATQLSIYAWLGGLEVGADFIAGIDQVVCKRNSSEFPELRFAEHRNLVHKNFQYETFNTAKNLWNVIHSDHFFRDRSKEDSEMLCKTLDDQMAANRKMEGDFLDMTKKAW